MWQIDWIKKKMYAKYQQIIPRSQVRNDEVSANVLVANMGKSGQI